MDSFEQLTSFRKFYAASERKPGNAIVKEYLALPRNEKKRWLSHSSRSVSAGSPVRLSSLSTPTYFRNIDFIEI